MDSDRACVLLLRLPKAAFCGIDLLSFTTSPKFQGIRRIPKGWHFVFTGIDSAFSIRHGLWFHVRGESNNAPEVFIFEWDKQLEELRTVEDQVTRLRLKANIADIWHEGLTPYRQSVPEADNSGNKEGDSVDGGEAWVKLTDCVSQPLLDRIFGASDNGFVWTLTSASSAAEDADEIPGLTQAEATGVPEKDLNFLPIDLKQTWRAGAVGRERTEAAQDRTWALKYILKEQSRNTLEVIGELQVSFIMILTLNNNSCMEQWKRILGLLLTCKAAPIEQPAFFTRFLQTLKLQLEHCSDAEGGLFDLSDEGATLLKSLLKRFRQGLDQQTGSQAKLDVMDELDELEGYLRSEHGWLMNEAFLKHGKVQLEDGDEVDLDTNGFDEEDEEGDYAPVLVDFTPELAQKLGMPAGSVRSEQTLRSRISEAEAADAEFEEEEQDLESMDARY